jgi:adenylate cyclase
VKPEAIAQGYLCTDPHRVVRIRRKDDQGFLTIKGRKTGNTTPEFEYPVPAQDVPELLAMCGADVLTKERFKVPGPDGKIWEVDIFTGRHADLMIAELELPAETAPYQKPAWLGAEITHDSRFSNASLVRADMKDVRSWLAEYK